MGEVTDGASRLDLTTGLIRSSALVQGVLATASAEHELTAQQAQLMCVVGDSPSSMMRLSTVLGVGKSSMTGLVHRAEQAGLVHRAPDPDDARSTLIMLTETGRQANAAYRATVGRRIEQIVATLPKTEREALAAALSTIVRTQRAPETWPTAPTTEKEHP